MTLSQSTNEAIQWVGPSYISEKIIATLQHMMGRPEVRVIVEAHERRVAEKDTDNV